MLKNIKVPKNTDMLKKFPWTRRKQLWQFYRQRSASIRKFIASVFSHYPKVYRSNSKNCSENSFFSEKLFPFEHCSGPVDCIFDNCAEKRLPRSTKIFCSKSEADCKFFLQRKHFPVEISSGHVKCRLDNSTENF